MEFPFKIVADDRVPKDEIWFVTPPQISMGITPEGKEFQVEVKPMRIDRIVGIGGVE